MPTIAIGIWRARQGWAAREPIKLIHVAESKLRLVDGLAANGVMPVCEREGRERARRNRQRTGPHASPFAQLRNDRGRIDAIAGTRDQARALRQSRDHAAQAAFGEHKVGIEEELPALRHRRAEIAESTM